MPPNTQAGDSRKLDCSHQLLVCHTVPCVIGRFCLALIGRTRQPVRRGANASIASIQDMRVNRGRANARCAGSSRRTTAAVNSTDGSLRFVFVLAVGQSDAAWRFARLQAVKETSAVAPSHGRQNGPGHRSPALTTRSRHMRACPRSVGRKRSAHRSTTPNALGFSRSARRWRTDADSANFSHASVRHTDARYSCKPHSMCHGRDGFSGLTFGAPFFLPCFRTLVAGGHNRPSGVGPVERLGKGLVEVLDEFKQSLLQFCGREKIPATQNATLQDAENRLDLVQPRGVLWQVHETNTMIWIGQKLLTRRH